MNIFSNKLSSKILILHCVCIISTADRFVLLLFYYLVLNRDLKVKQVSNICSIMMVYLYKFHYALYSWYITATRKSGFALKQILGYIPAQVCTSFVNLSILHNITKSKFLSNKIRK